MTLEYLAFWWLRFEKRCKVALFGRSPRSGSCGLPDVLGITQGRHLYEIEIKRSVSDFKANAKKPFHVGRNFKPWGEMYPVQFWFLVPNELVEKVTPLVPDWAGLMRGPIGNELVVVKKAPKNPESKKLSAKECVRLAHCMSNQILSFARGVCERSGWNEHNEKWIQKDYEI